MSKYAVRMRWNEAAGKLPVVVPQLVVIAQVGEDISSITQCLSWKCCWPDGCKRTARACRSVPAPDLYNRLVDKLRVCGCAPAGQLAVRRSPPLTHGAGAIAALALLCDYAGLSTACGWFFDRGRAGGSRPRPCGPSATTTTNVIHRFAGKGATTIT